MLDVLAPEIVKKTNENNNGKSSPRSPREERREIATSKETPKGEKGADKKKKVKRIVSMESGFESVQGRRKNMEDTHVIIDDFRVRHESNHHRTFFESY